jgi:hypothetical protein
LINIKNIKSNKVYIQVHSQRYLLKNQNLLMHLFKFKYQAPFIDETIILIEHIYSYFATKYLFYNHEIKKKFITCLI